MYQIVRSLLPIRCLPAPLLVQQTESRLLLIILSIIRKVPSICLLGHRLYQQMCTLLAIVDRGIVRPAGLSAEKAGVVVGDCG